MRAALLGVVAALALGGCYRGSAHSVSAAELSREGGWQLVSDVGYIPQATEHACGVAAGALRDLARAKGLHAFLIQGEEADLFREVELNRPVLVGLVQRYTDRSYSHYAVVTGINRRTRHILMLDPGHGLREDDLGSFAIEWQGAGRLALVVGPS